MIEQYKSLESLEWRELNLVGRLENQETQGRLLEASKTELRSEERC